MWLFRIPAFAGLVGLYWLWRGAMGLMTLAEEPVPVTCDELRSGSPDHLLLRGCFVGDVLIQGYERAPTAYWLILTDESGQTQALVKADNDYGDDVDVMATARLNGQGLRIVRAQTRDADDDLFADFPEVASAAYVGELSMNADGSTDSGPYFFLVLGFIAVGWEVFRTRRWLARHRSEDERYGPKDSDEPG